MSRPRRVRRPPGRAQPDPAIDYRRLFDASPTPCLVVDRRLRVVGANRAHLRAMRREPGDIVGRPAFEAYPTDPDAARRSVESIERVVRQRTPDTMAPLRSDIRRPDAEGGGSDERWWNIVHTPVLDDRGEVAFVLQQGIDVTEHHRAIQALHEGEERFKRAAEKTLVGHFSWDIDSGRVTLPPVGRALFGFGDGPIHIDQVFDKVHPDDLPAVRAGVEPAFDPSGDGTMRAAYRIVHSDGSMRWADSAGHVRFEPQRDGAARPVQAVGVILDVTEEQRLLASLREADQRKNEFLAMLAHELRNPLAPLTNALRLIARKETLSVAGDQAVAMATRQLRQLARLVDDLLEVSRVSQGRIELRRELVSIGAAVFHAAESVQGAFESRRQEIELAVPAERITVHADPARLAQIMENLLVNASKFTPEGGRIRIEVVDRASEVEVRVIDNGAGIEAGKLSQLFELFHQLDATMDRSQGGLGIGLALVRRLVELHGGSVSAASAGLGEGATFTVRLPRRGPV